MFQKSPRHFEWQIERQCDRVEKITQSLLGSRTDIGAPEDVLWLSEQVLARRVAHVIRFDRRRTIVRHHQLFKNFVNDVDVRQGRLGILTGQRNIFDIRPPIVQTIEWFSFGIERASSSLVRTLDRSPSFFKGVDEMKQIHEIGRWTQDGLAMVALTVIDGSEKGFHRRKEPLQFFTHGGNLVVSPLRIRRGRSRSIGHSVQPFEAIEHVEYCGGLLLRFPEYLG